jgi:heme/copper-type cytochrome/quinol oxidase subunit 2
MEKGLIIYNKMQDITKNPKITATIVFTTIVFSISFLFGYKQDKDKHGKEYSAKHHVLNGLKWAGIVITIIALLSVTIAIIFGLNGLDMFLWGGELINIIGQIVITLLTTLTN